MKKPILSICLIFFLQFSVSGFVPGFYGARMLSLGFAGAAYNYDVNAVFINPALLSSVNQYLTGYQYQNSASGYKDFLDRLNGVLEYDLARFSSLPIDDRQVLFSELQDLFNYKNGLSGFTASLPGFVARDYGLSVSVVQTALVDPVDSTVLQKAVTDVTDTDIASLQMNFLGLSYTQVTMATALPLAQGITLGVSLHYMFGKLTEFRTSIVDDLFQADMNANHYLEHAWDAANTKINKLNVDLGLLADVGRNFKLGLVVKNVGSPTFVTADRDLVLERRITAALAFRPTAQWGIYVDMDLTKSDLFLNGNKVQLLSLGLEKGFFNNKLFVRAGLLSDFTESYFFGRRSNSLYGLGFGFNMGRLFVDFALGLNSQAGISNLAVSGFIKFN